MDAQGSLPQMLWKIIGAIVVIALAKAIIEFFLATTIPHQQGTNSPGPNAPQMTPTAQRTPTTPTASPTGTPQPTSASSPNAKTTTSPVASPSLSNSQRFNDPGARHADLQSRKQALLESARKKFLEKEYGTSSNTKPLASSQTTSPSTPIKESTTPATSTTTNVDPITPTKQSTPPSLPSTPLSTKSDPLSKSTPPPSPLSDSQPSSPLSNSTPTSPSTSAKRRKQGLSLETGELRDASEVQVTEEDRETKRRRALEALQKRLGSGSESS